MLETVFEKIRDEVAVYIDDIFPIGTTKTTPYEHYLTLCRIFDILRKEKLYVNRRKRKLFVEDNEPLMMLGHEVGKGTYRPEAAKVKAFAALRSPSSFQELGRDNGIFGYLTDHLPFANAVAAPLHQLLHADRWEWTATHEEAFRRMKELVEGHYVLHAIDLSSEGEKLWVITDASLVGIGGWIAQGPTIETAKPVAFHSRVLTPTQSNYPVHGQELLAVVDILETYHHLLIGREFTLLTDGRAMVSLFTQKHLSPRQSRWIIFLNAFQMKIEYIPGKQNVIADALSKIAERQTYQNDLPSVKDASDIPGQNFLQSAALTLCRGKVLPDKPVIRQRPKKAGVGDKIARRDKSDTVMSTQAALPPTGRLDSVARPEVLGKPPKMDAVDKKKKRPKKHRLTVPTSIGTALDTTQRQDDSPTLSVDDDDDDVTIIPEIVGSPTALDDVGILSFR
jgi:hypothetical protein